MVHGLLKIFTLFLFIICALSSYSQWHWQNPLPTGQNYRGCDFIDSAQGWIVGDWGCIIRTSDGGLTWELQHTGVEADLYDVYFLNENYGWAVGNRGTILHTKNGGANWLIQQYGTVTSAYISSVYFSDSLHGWTDGTSGGGQYYRTINGGIDWQTEQIPGVSYSWELSSMFFSDSLFFWAFTGPHEIKHTEDGGNTWINNYSPTGWGEIFFFNHDTGWITANSQIYRTNDRAVTWTEQDHPNQGPMLLDLCFTDPFHGWAAGGNIMLSTVNGGETWENYETDVLFWNVEFSDPDNGWAVGGWNGELYHSKDGGVSWRQERLGTEGFITDIRFGSQNFGVAIFYTLATEHSLLLTNDGGNTWQQQSLLGDSTWWYGLSVTDENNAWLCGKNGTIMHTGNAGLTWEVQRENQPDVRLSEIQFLNLLDGFAAGMDTTYETLFLVKTSDGGLSWSTLADSFDGYMDGMWFTDIDNGYIVAKDIDADQAVILITRNGGDSWEMRELPLSTFEYGSSIQFVSQEIGFISADNYILKTTDKGETWDKTHINGQANSLWFVDSLNGWCVGQSGDDAFTLRTTDGGAHWDNVPLISNNQLLDVCFISLDNGWVCGDGGTILKWGQENPVTVNDNSFPKNKSECFISPNPADSYIRVSCFSRLDQDLTFRIYTLTGQLSKSISYRNIRPDNAIIINLDDLNCGIYFYTISAGNTRNSGTFIVIH